MRVGIIVAGVLLAGCAEMTPLTNALGVTQERTQVCMSATEAREALATVKAVYDMVQPVAVANLPKFIPAHQKRITEADAALKKLFFEMQRWISTPGVEVNWRRVNEYLAILISAAV